MIFRRNFQGLYEALEGEVCKWRQQLIWNAQIFGLGVFGAQLPLYKTRKLGAGIYYVGTKLENQCWNMITFGQASESIN